MKTFKLVSLQIVEDTALKDIELTDGLIINKEDERSTWLIEAFISKDYFDYFNQPYQNNDDLIVQAVITDPENDPAPFKVKIRSIKEINHHISVLFGGVLKKSRNEYAELVLSELLEKGLDGDDLLKAFQQKMRMKPSIAAFKNSN
ncbi:YwpF-like family protein [Bacillus aquiflavi]|uniref:YwpF-like family protein n=1 Tax=Bacillus aquiflavi TaxID=2672567 RepID=A0A6B3VXL7_9BACI|nr:YwpF-like family protein [Bacillus aquiflavi]MBA4536669.1 YwpF-like family protein [Bacillus aquiflavi]NEY81037.1 hypothetical protein [Bacillus aquiflavi]UAC47892.1 YwpF-like family protein [Bacillus aquiflavi]